MTKIIGSPRDVAEHWDSYLQQQQFRRKLGKKIWKERKERSLKENDAAYKLACEINAKHGINPIKARSTTWIRKSVSRKRVTLPKVGK
jgi:cell shape-determining protein MreC